ncbi:MAG: sulfite exporter TauE/SafE family protein [Pseudomonadota bacterium]
MIALVCNIIVVSRGVWRFSRSGHLSLRRFLPFLVTSIPMAWFGGRLLISETAFVALLGLALLLSGLRLALGKSIVHDSADTIGSHYVSSGIAGAGIGFLSGLVGIGGGIFRAPVLYMMKWEGPRQIAAASLWSLPARSRLLPSLSVSGEFLLYQERMTCDYNWDILSRSVHEASMNFPTARLIIGRA